jgi:hypothetical protein
MLNAMASQGVPASVIGKVTEPSAGYIRVE